MIACDRRSVSFFCFLFTSLIFLTCYFLFNIFQDDKLKENENQQTDLILTLQGEKQEKENSMILTNEEQIQIWKIKIPKISLEAPISETITNSTMKKTVGHFKESSKWDGNVCLAAHNRGYNYGFFKDIHQLEVGDMILYQTEKGTRQYRVSMNKTIKETNRYYLENTKENYLTLFTCVKNKPNERVCIRAQQMES